MEVKEYNGKRYWGDQPEIKIECMSDAKRSGSNHERKITRLARAVKKSSYIDLIQVSPTSKPPIATKKGGEDGDQSEIKSNAKRTSCDMGDADHKHLKMESKFDVV